MMIDKSVLVERPPKHSGATGRDHFAMEERIYFASLALQNVQELNARADSKAYLVMTTNGFLITFLGWMVGPVQHVWQRGLTVGVMLHIASTAALILTVAVSLSHAFRIISPRLKRSGDRGGTADHGKQVHRARLFFFMDIIHTHATDEEYTDALLNAPPEELLANLSSSIYGSSISAHEKYRDAGRSIRALGPVLLAWMIFVALTFALS
ncbi:MAG: DUF5706 domain-containing protein [Chloroflexi bacterium]|nr:DUF5706 domain-containing protein [Chloroflexota bacterium]